MSNVRQPERPLRKEEVLPILFLADKMAKVDGSVAREEMSAIDSLAEAAEMKDFRNARGYDLFGEDDSTSGTADDGRSRATRYAWCPRR